MSKLVLIGSKYAGEKNDVSQLAAAIPNQPQVTVQVVYWEDLLFDIAQNHQSITDTVSQLDLASADLVFALNWYKNGKQSIYRDAALTLALYLSTHKVAFWNEEMLKQRSTTKLSAMMQLALTGFDVPHTRFSLNAAVLQAQATQFPAIIKAATASRGRANYVVQDISELTQRLAKGEAPNLFLLQEYVPNQSDMRVVCANYEPRLVIERRRTDATQHLNNISQGAKASLVNLNELDPAILQACRDICHDMGRTVAGIDIMQASDGSNRVVFLEANAIPQLTSGAFVKDKLSVTATALLEALAIKEQA